MNHNQFDKIVQEAVQELPADIRGMLSNVEITVEDRPSAELLASLGLPPGSALFGLYRGIPQTKRSRSYNLVPPDRISIFREPIIRAHQSQEAIKHQIKRTVLHEIGHHFGLTEKRLRELGYG